MMMKLKYLKINMINYDNFHKYVCELCELYRTTHSLKGMSVVAKKYQVKALTKEQFFHLHLHDPKWDKGLFDNNGNPTKDYTDAIRRDMSDIDRIRYGGKVKDKEDKKTTMSIFEDSLPWGYKVEKLIDVDGSPYQYALCADTPVDNAEAFSYMIRGEYTKMKKDAVKKQIDTLYPNNGGIREFYEFMMPTICGMDYWIEKYNVGFVKVNNNGTSFWLAEDGDILRLFTWLAFVVS